MTAPILRLDAVSKDFAVETDIFGRPTATLRAVSEVTLDALPGESLGIVGESGCGKTTLSRLILRLAQPSAGRIEFEGRDITALTQKQMRPLRSQMQIVFQDPHSSLNPRLTVRDIIAEPLESAGWKRADIRARVAEVMETVGLPPDTAERYPHAFSGGQRQRIGIARALAVKPRLIVCDEAVSALDVSVQAQLLNLLRQIQRDTGVTLVFISHNLGVIRFLCHRVAVMYLGRIVEIGSQAAIFDRPAHPYTAALLAAIPEPDPRRRGQRQALKGDIPSPINPPPGCPFHQRCPRAQDRCRSERPELKPHAPEQSVACHYPA